MRIYSICLMTLCLFTFACKRKDGNDKAAGKGGTAVISAVPRHHNETIDSCIVYIKYNTLDASTVYDDSTRAVKVNGIPVATFTGLKNGNYYLYGEGWDPSIVKDVRGGLPVVVSEQKTYEVNLPITEVH